MQTRNKSPFKTDKCTDCDCDVPQSTRSDQCSRCDNIRQVCGISWLEIDTVNINKVSLSSCLPSKYAFELTVNGETERYSFYDKSKRDSRYREYKAIVQSAKDGCSLCE